MKKSIVFLLLIAIAFIFVSCKDEVEHTCSVLDCVAAKDATCSTVGNKTYYVCNCGKIYLDSACTQPANFSDIVIAKDPNAHCYTEDSYNWKNIEGTNTYGKTCDLCGQRVVISDVTHADLVGGSEFAVDIYSAAGCERDVVSRIEFVSGCEVPAALSDYEDVSTVESEYPAWLEWDPATGTVFVKTSADVFKLNGDCVSLFDQDYMYSPYSLKSIDFNHLVDTSAVEDFEYFLYNCLGLTELDLSDFDTTAATGMSNMFYNCESITSLDLSSFDTSGVVTMGYMFCGCKSIKELDLSNFKLDGAETISGMFQGCHRLEKLDISSFDTQAIENLELMFCDCYSLKELDVSNFDTSSAVYVRNMFQNCASLRELDLSSFDTSSVGFFDSMFEGCNASITLGSGWTMDSPTSTTDMFKDFWKDKVLITDQEYDVITGIPDGELSSLNALVVPPTSADIGYDSENTVIKFKGK